MSRELEGQCLCGAVRITAVAQDAAVSACHCSLCRRWSGAALWGLDVAPGSFRVEGDVATYRSTPFAERAFCPVCGTHLWLRDDGKEPELVPGLFDAAAGFPLVREVYADRAIACVTLAGDHQRVSRAEYEASHPFVEGDA